MCLEGQSRRASNYKANAQDKTPKHGTVRGYVTYGCRCDACTIAASEPQRRPGIRLARELKAVPCSDCGAQYPYYVMQFDHLPERGAKQYNISELMVSGSTEALKAEAAKCEVVCANCHAERTHERLVERNNLIDSYTSGL